MAKKAYVGVSSKSRLLKNIYVGVNGVAKKVVKAYVGVNGKARQIWPKSASWPTYYKKTYPLSYRCSELASANLEPYAIFCDLVGVVAIAINTSLSGTSVDGLIGSAARSGMGITSIGNYALFVGGQNSGVNTAVDAYDTSLTHQEFRLDGSGGGNLGATTLGNYAIFAGAYRSSHTYSDAFTFNKSLTYSESISNLSSSRHSSKGVTIGNSYAVFGPGWLRTSRYNKGNTAVDAYNSSLTLTTLESVTSVDTPYPAASLGNRAVFLSYGQAADVYNSSLTRTYYATFTSGTPNDYSYPGTCINGFMMVPLSNNTIDIFNESLTKQTITGFYSDGRTKWGANHVGDYALFVAGTISDGDTNTNQYDMFVYRT